MLSEDRYKPHYTSEEVNQGQHIFKTFWKSGFHGHEWPKETHAVLVIPGMIRPKETDAAVVISGKKKQVMVFDSKGTHAEEKIIDQLNKLSPKFDSEEAIRMYMNYSPCTDCARELIEYLTVQVNIRLDIYVAALYKIQRESCSNHQHKKSDKSRPGMLELLAFNKIKHQAKLRTFNRNAWKTLADILSLLPSDTKVFYKYSSKNAP